MIRGAATAAGALALIAGSAAGAVPRPGMLELGGPIPPGVLPAQLEEVGVDERLGETLPLDLELTDHEGRKVRLGDYFGRGRPVVVNLAYYECPMLCGLVMKGLVKSVRELSYLPGREFEVVTVSIDPRETTELARAKRESALEELARPGAESGWSFHTASQAEVDRLAKAVGFRFRWDGKGKQWAHPAAIALASPEGKLTRYLYGIEYPASDLKLAVLESGEGKVGTTAERLLLYCFTYDGASREYVLFARNLMKAGGLMTMLALGTFLLVHWRRERAR